MQGHGEKGNYFLMRIVEMAGKDEVRFQFRLVKNVCRLVKYRKFLRLRTLCNVFSVNRNMKLITCFLT